jgi:subtilisin family serine protease
VSKRFFRFFLPVVLLILFFSLNAVAEAVSLESINGLKAPSELELLKNNQKAVREQLIDKKSNLKESRKKISSDLLRLIDENYLPPGQTRENLRRQMQELKQYRLETSQQRVMASEERELVYVYIYLAPAVETSYVEKYAREVTHRDEANHLAAAWVEVKNLEALAADDAVRAVRTIMPPRVKTGSFTSAGDLIHRADQVRAQFGQDGAGIKIGIISNGVDNWKTARNSGDLPSNLTVLSNSVGGDEGTAMLEIVHDLAPGAELYFHDCGNNKIAFNKAISNLAAAGCQIICDDIGWITEPFFEDGIIARHVASLLAEKNIIYVSATGNEAKRHYQGMYYDQGDGCHDFSGGSSNDKYLYVRIQPGQTARIVLQWDDQFGSSSNDYDLYLWDSASEMLLGMSNDPQTGSSDPLEWIIYTNKKSSPVDCLIDIYKFSGSPKNLEVFIYDCTVYTNNISPADSIFGHPAVPGAIAVGAINAAAPSQIANYSSQGPVTIRYPAAETRNKPDVCGIDGVRVTGAGGFSSTFYGTSAAAPHVAAIAALTWAQYPEKTAAEIRALLLSEVVDLGLPGFDYIYGTGRADALNCIQKGDSTPPAYQGAAISEDYKTVTLTFSENLIANTADLKGAVTFAADGTTFASLGRGDTVSLSDNKLVVTFKAALTGNKNRLMVAAGSLKDAAGNVLNSTVTTDALEAGINGDLNGDNVVDLTDLLWLAQHLGLKEGDPAWESACITDVNNDRVINILDLIMVAELQ